MTTWLSDPKGCSNCAHCAMDMELEPFCIHPKAAALTGSDGLVINEARNGPCNGGELFERRTALEGK